MTSFRIAAAVAAATSLLGATAPAVAGHCRTTAATSHACTHAARPTSHTTVRAAVHRLPHYVVKCTRRGVSFTRAGSVRVR